MGLNCSKTPCKNCPYRKDAPLAHWAVLEFDKLLDSEEDFIGKSFDCHKQNGKLCTGWVMNQDRRQKAGTDKIAFRISMSKQNVTVAELDALHCPVPMFKTIEAMCFANFPELQFTR